MIVRHIGDESTIVRAGGLNRYVTELARAQRAEGLDASVQVVGAADADEHSVGPTTASLDRRVRAHRRMLAARPTDLVDVHFAVYALLVPRRLPLVAHFQGPWGLETAAQGDRRGLLARRRIERRVLRRAARVVVLSQFMADLAVDTHRLDPARLRVIPPGVDLTRFSPGPSPEARRALDLPDTEPIVLTVRRLVRRTGVDLLIDAHLDLPDPKPTLVIAGTGPEEEDLRRRAGSAESIRFLGAVDDDLLPDLFRAADVSVVPSRSLEGFGLVVLESLACGTPVIGTDVGGLPEFLDNRPACTMVTPDATAIAQAVQKVLSEPPDRASARAQAETYGWAPVAQEHIRLYSEVVDRP